MITVYLFLGFLVLVAGASLGYLFWMFTLYRVRKKAVKELKQKEVDKEFNMLHDEALQELKVYNFRNNIFT